MLIHLTEFLHSEGKTEQMQIPYETDTYCNRMGEFPIVEKTPLLLTITNIGDGKAELAGDMRLTVSIPCDRCLTEVKVPLSLRIAEEISEEAIGHATDDADAISYMEGSQLDSRQLIANEIMVNWPMKILCRQDCKGICSRCGQNLNLGECGCDTFVPDPRMAVIKDIFNANKEV